MGRGTIVFVAELLWMVLCVGPASLPDHVKKGNWWLNKYFEQSSTSEQSKKPDVNTCVTFTSINWAQGCCPTTLQMLNSLMYRIWSLHITHPCLPLQSQQVCLLCQSGLVSEHVWVWKVRARVKSALPFLESVEVPVPPQMSPPMIYPCLHINDFI